MSLTISHISYPDSYYNEDDDDRVVYVYSGESITSPVIGRYTSRRAPPTLVSDGSAITISIGQEMDFFATYSVLDSCKEINRVLSLILTDHYDLPITLVYRVLKNDFVK